jgi:hypothetical protein
MYLAVLVAGIVAFSIVPAYAEVTSLKTSAQFYKGGNTIYFSGTVLDTDPPNVTILIFNPNGQFVMLTSGIADSNHQFQISVDTSNPDNQQKLSIKGTYNATAFIANKENGKTVSFVFSPDGSPVAPFSPSSLTASVVSSTEIDLRWSVPANTGGTILSGYKIERDDGTGFKPIQNVQSTSYQDTGLTPNKLYSYRVSAINTAGTSDPSNVATAVTLSPPAQTTPSIQTTGSTPDQPTSLEDLLKKRLEDAKRLQELLNGKTSPAGTQQTINLNENMAVGDMAASLETPKSDNTQENNSMPSIGNFNMAYPAISLVGVGLVVGILYMRKKQKFSIKSVTAKKETPMPAGIPVDVPSEKQDEDYAMMILKNRLAKGEITLDQFKEIKEELSEP